MKRIALAAALGLALTPAAHGGELGICCGPGSFYNEQNSTPLQFQEDNATGHACCGRGSEYEIQRAWQEEFQQQQQQQFQQQQEMQQENDQ